MATLLLHPVGLDRHSWRWSPITAGKAVDLPGHGDEPMRELDSLDEVADAVMDSPGMRSETELDLVGLSLGGMVALHIALRYPERVRSLVVACAPAATPTQIMLDRARDSARIGMAGVVESTMTRWFSAAECARPGPGSVYTRKRLSTDDPLIFSHYWRLVAGHDVIDRLGEISIPTTIIAGTGDVSSPPERMRELAAGIPDSRYVELDGPHMLHLEAPEVFAAAVNGHLARLA